MRTKKTACLLLIVILLLSVGAVALTACNNLTAQEAYDALKNAINLSLAGDPLDPAYDPEVSETNGYIFAYKESVRSSGNITNTNVNVHCDQDASYQLHVDEDLMVDLYQETWSINDVTGGTGTKIGDFGFIVGPYPNADSDEERMFYTERPADGNNGEYAANKIYGNMTAEDFIETELFRKYSLASRLEELRNMPFDAFVFDKSVNDSFGAVQQINLVTITFGVTSEYVENYYAETGKHSIFEGCTYAEIELTFGRVSNIYVYQEENLGGGFFNLPQEMYSLQITYLGQNISFPSVSTDPSNSNYYTLDENLLGRTDLAFAKAIY